MTQKIFVLYTGGTIGMSQSEDGLRPDTALVDQALRPFSDGIDFDWHVCQPLIDSSAVTLANQAGWLALIAEKLPQYDGILILHGTDTLAYTANLIALALPSPAKPIILTGSQWPYHAPDSDAPLNLATAVTAFSLDIRQTAVAFNGKLFPAVGSSKVSTENAAGFDNPHFGAWAHYTPQGWQHLAEPRVQPPAADHARIDPDARVVCHTLIPGFSAQALSDGLEHTAAQAVILQSYGHGNAPDTPEFIAAVSRFSARGGLVLNISQVPQGCAAAVYAQGHALRHAGVINGGKCNLETAFALMTLAVSNGWSAAQIEQKLAEHHLIDLQTPAH